MFHRIYLHLVWTTRGRAPLLDRSIACFLSGFLRAMARNERAYILEIGMVETHVHVLARVHPGTSIPRLVQRLKGASAVVAAQRGYGGERGRLLWNKGYAVHSVSGRALERLRRYLRAQPHRHPAEAIAGWEGDTPEYDGESARGA